MYRITGMISILISAVLAGFFMSNELKERVRLLKELLQDAIHIKSEFEYRAPVLSECFENRGILFKRAADYMAEGNNTPKEALIKASNEIKKFRQEEKEIIFSFSKNLPKEDIQGQIANISWFIVNIEAVIKRAEEEYVTKSRLYKSGGILAGVGFIILLL